MPHSEQVGRQGGKHSVEVQIGLSRSEVHTLLLVGRRLRAYADQNLLVEPLALDRLAGMILDMFDVEMIKWLDSAAVAERARAGRRAASSSGPGPMDWPQEPPATSAE